MHTTTLSQYLSGIYSINYIHEDDQCVAFEEELTPQAPVHFVVVPKKDIVPRLCDVTIDDEKLLGHLMIVAHNIAQQNNLNSTGYHVLIDEDFRTYKFKALHVFGRSLQHMIWPVYQSML